MTMLEDRVRRAIHAKAREIPPAAPPPLRLPTRRRPLARRGLSARWLSGGRGLSLVAPVAAAATVVAAIAALFAVAGAMQREAPRPASPFAARNLPRYYVTLAIGWARCCQAGERRFPRADAMVRITATGQAVARIAPPRPYRMFTGVAAAADDRTFVLAAETGASPATKFFLIRLDPGGRPGPLIPLPIPPPALGVSDLALSPNGALLAFEDAGHGRSLFVFNTATGAERAWVPPGMGSRVIYGAWGSLSWTADGRTLALIYGGIPGKGGIRLLDVAAHGSNLLANSRLAVGQPKNAGVRAYWLQAQVTPDGHTIIAIRNPAAHFSQQLGEYSARTGKLLRVLSDIRFRYGGYEKVEWVSPSGNVLIVLDARRGGKVLHGYDDANAGVLRDGHYTPLPWPSRTFAAAW